MKKFTRPLFLVLLIAFVSSWTVVLNDKNDVLFKYKISSLESFKWKKGEERWSDMEKKRLKSSLLVFHKDGMFTFSIPWDSNNSYLIDGTYKKHNNGSYTFRAFESTGGSVNGNHILINGALYYRNSLPQATIHFASGDHRGARINDVKFKETAIKMYSAKVKLH
jgi:hypothetical protein